MDLSKYTIGKEAYLYKPPTMADTTARGRRAKHFDHYVGPGLITRHIGTRKGIPARRRNDYVGETDNG